jgi:NH3-dependent NAD+ synthetase
MSLEEKFDDFVSSLESKFVPSDETVVRAIDSIRSSLRDYVESCNLQSLVIGLHGDLDSTVVAALCQEEYTGVPLLGVQLQSNANWVGQAYCNKYHQFESLMHINNHLDSFMYETWREFKDFNGVSAPTTPDITPAMLECIARQTNGITLGSRTWSDVFATFLGSQREGDYFPIDSINKGFELPVFAKQLGIPQNIIDEPSPNEQRIGATYREVDVIINGHIGNFDNNFTTQFERYRSLEKVQRVLLRYDLNYGLLLDDISRTDLDLPIYYSY